MQAPVSLALSRAPWESFAYVAAAAALMAGMSLNVERIPLLSGSYPLSLGTDELGLALYSVVVAYLSRRRLWSAVRDPFGFAAWMTVASLVVSAANSGFASYSLQWAGRYALLIVALVVTRAFAQADPEGPRLVARTCVAWTALVGLSVLPDVAHQGLAWVTSLQYLTLHGGFLRPYRAEGIAGHPNVLGAVLLLGATFTAVAWRERWVSAWTTVMVAVLAAHGILASLSRNAWFATLATAATAGVGALVPSLRARARATILATVVFFGATVALISTVALVSTYLSGAVPSNMLREGIEALDPFRALMWTTAWDLWLQHPWTGVGPGVFPLVARLAWEQRWPDVLDAGHHPHNLYLHLLVDLGLLGLICTLAWLRAMSSVSMRRHQLLPLAAVIWSGFLDSFATSYVFSLTFIWALATLTSNPSRPRLRE